VNSLGYGHGIEALEEDVKMNAEVWFKLDAIEKECLEDQHVPDLDQGLLSGFRARRGRKGRNTRHWVSCCACAQNTHT
jgi:hypothetical protein